MAERAITVKILGDAKGAMNAMRQTETGLAGLASKAQAAAKVAAAAFVGVGVAATGLAITSVKAASDLSESLNKANVIFGQSGAAITEFAKTSAFSFGLSRRAAFEYTATLGTILNVSGLTASASSQMSVELVKLAADMASFNNIPIDLALEKLRSGLVGEAEPLRTVGVLLSAARVEAAAYALGIAKTGAVLTEGQKVQARYQVILADTAASQGDFARTSTGMANQQRILTAQFENLRAELGERLLPLVNRGLVAITSWIDSHQEDLTQWMAAGQEAAERLWKALGNVGETLAKIAAFPPIQVAISSIPVELFIAAGLAAIVRGNLPLALGIFALGGVTAILGRAGCEEGAEGANPRQITAAEAAAVGTLGGRLALPGGLKGVLVDPRTGEVLEPDISGRYQVIGQVEPEAKTGGGLPGAAGTGGGRAAIPNIGMGGGGGSGAAAKADRFSEAMLAMIDELMARLPKFTFDGMAAAATVDAWTLAAQGFARVSADIQRQMAELGLEMADLDARGLELTPQFKAMEERMAALRDVASRIDLVKQLRLDPFADAVARIGAAIEEGAKRALRAENLLLDARLSSEREARRMAGGMTMRSMAEARMRELGIPEEEIRLALQGIPDLPNVARFAGGGIVGGPLGAPQLAVVHGGEVVTPPGLPPIQVSVYIGDHQLDDVIVAVNERNARRGR